VQLELKRKLKGKDINILNKSIVEGFGFNQEDPAKAELASLDKVRFENIELDDSHERMTGELPRYKLRNTELEFTDRLEDTFIVNNAISEAGNNDRAETGSEKFKDEVEGSDNEDFVDAEYNQI
jgi:hypothetical protein